MVSFLGLVDKQFCNVDLLLIYAWKGSFGSRSSNRFTQSLKSQVMIPNIYIVRHLVWQFIEQHEGLSVLCITSKLFRFRTF